MLSEKKIFIIVAALALMVGIFFLPDVPGLTGAGKAALSVLVFAVIMWVTQAVSYPVSAVAIIAFLTLFLGFSPAQGVSGPLLGTGRAISLALSGFINGGWVLVAAGLFMAAGIIHCGLERRIAYQVLRVFGTKVRNIFAGIIALMALLCFVIPSMTARSATITPIAVGLVEALGLDLKSKFGSMLLVTVAITSSVSGMLLLTSGAPNPVALSFIGSQLNHEISWLDWFIYAAPYAVSLLIIFYFLVTRLNTFEFDEAPGGREFIEKKLAELGPMTKKEKKIAIIFGVTILFWMTQGIHHIDANTVSILSVLAMLFPGVGIGSWKDLCKRVDAGTILLFGAGISLGNVLLHTEAALWLAEVSLGNLHLEHLPPLLMMVPIMAALLIIRFAFASTTSSAAALVPTVIGFLLSLHNGALPMWGMAFIATMTVYFSFILPVHSPQAMIPYATQAFEVKDMIKMGIPFTIISLVVLLVFVFTYWHWLGLI